MSLRIAKIVAVHPTRRTVDLVFTDNGMRVANVQVMGDASSDSGSWNVPDVPKPTREGKADTLATSGRNLVALVGFVGTRPVVTGFLHPSNTQLSFNEQNRQVSRHPSGSYTTTGPDGSMEVFHASGAYLRIGAGVHQDLAAVSADSNWTVPAGAAPAQITLVTAGFTLTIAPNGATTLTTTGQLNLNYANAVLTGDLKLNGKLDVSGEVTAKAGSGASVTLSQHKHPANNTAPTPGT